MSDHRTSTAMPESIGELSRNTVNGLSRDTDIARAMRGLENTVHELTYMTDIMSDLVFDAFSHSGKKASDQEADRALFCVNDVQRRVSQVREAYLAALDAERAGAASGLAAVIETAERAYDAWTSSVPKDVDLPDNDEGKAYDQAETDFLKFPCRTHDDVVAKVAYLVNGKNNTAKTLLCTLESSRTSIDAFLASILGKEI